MSDNKYSLIENKEFGFKQIEPTPSPEEIEEFYSKEFYDSYPNFNDSALEVQQKDKEWLDDRRQEIVESISSLLGRPLEGLEVLDIGCGWGENLFYFNEKGMACYGFDPAPEAVEYAQKRGLNVLTSGMDKMNVFDKKFDVVTLFNVLEHLSDPVETIREIKSELLKPGGVLIIDVPNEFNAFQTAAVDIHDLNQWWVGPPAHLNYFSVTTLNNLLEGCGLKVKISESSFPLEMFLVMGENYVGQPELGSACHQKRILFETNLRRTGRGEQLREFYQKLAEINLGRQIMVFAVNE